ncbi:MAG: hypothetical protein KatS3mg118_0002 [Paracoccaceae bacterium]|nr:MAG: hypothetical protein KatS3mg118_0002 [Paracoccaceae bacterium]
MRCRSTGGASASTSSTAGASRRRAGRGRARRASAPGSRAGPGPQATALDPSIASVLGPAGAHQAQRSLHDLLADRDAAHQRCAACASARAAIEHRSGRLLAPVVAQAASALGVGRDSSTSICMQEPVELRLGQRVGALLLDRVLRRQHVEGRGSECIWPATVTRRSCIACSSADWVRGLARLISSAISSWQKTAPRRNGSAPALLGPLQHLGTEDVGRHQVGGELHRPAARPSTRPIVSTSSVLARPGTPTSSTCPPASSVTKASSSTRSCPKITSPGQLGAGTGHQRARRLDLLQHRLGCVVHPPLPNPSHGNPLPKTLR